jgi:uncharacterized protein
VKQQRFGDHCVLRLFPGEEVVTVLTDYVRREEIHGGYLLGFGAFSDVSLRYFDMASKQYRSHTVAKQVEAISLLGNIARLPDGSPKLHLHASVADVDGKTNSGDLEQGHVQPTLEIFLTRFSGELRREHDAATGLDLLALTGE